MVSAIKWLIIAGLAVGAMAVLGFALYGNALQKRFTSGVNTPRLTLIQGGSGAAATRASEDETLRQVDDALRSFDSQASS